MHSLLHMIHGVSLECVHLLCSDLRNACAHHMPDLQPTSNFHYQQGCMLLMFWIVELFTMTHGCGNVPAACWLTTTLS